LSNFESELGDAVETINEEQKKMKNLEETLAQQVSKLPYPMACMYKRSLFNPTSFQSGFSTLSVYT